MGMPSSCITGSDSELRRPPRRVPQVSALPSSSTTTPSPCTGKRGGGVLAGLLPSPARRTPARGRARAAARGRAGGSGAGAPPR